MRWISAAAFVPLWAGLLLVGSPVPTCAEHPSFGELQVHLDDGLVSVIATEAPLDVVIREIAVKANLKLIQHVALDIAARRQPEGGVELAVLMQRPRGLLHPEGAYVALYRWRPDLTPPL